MADDEYISHIIGKITEAEYNLIDKPFTPAWLEVFKPNRRVVPAILYIEKNYPNKTLTGKQIEETLLSLNFSKNASINAMRVFSANKYVNQKLKEQNRNIEYLAYTKTFNERSRIYFPIGTLIIDTRYAREDNIHIRPIQVPEEVIPPELCSFFEYIDQLIGENELNQLETYRLPNQVDALTEYIEEEDYDGALERVHKPINDILIRYFKYLHLKREGEEIVNEPDLILSTDQLGFGTVEKPECPESRTYELQIYSSDARIPFEKESAIYGLTYTKGAIVNIHGFGDIFPEGVVIDVLKREGKWEE